MLAFYAQLAFALAVTPTAPQHGEKVTPSLLATDFADVLYHEVSPDGQWLVYLADQPLNPMDFSSPPQVFSVPVDGSAEPVRLNPELAPGGSIWWINSPPLHTDPPFRITADGARVLFSVREGAGQTFDLFSAPIDGSVPAVQLHPESTFGSALEYKSNADGSQVVFLADHAVDFRYDLFLVPADGSSPPVQLTALPSSSVSIDEWALSPTGNRVVFQADLLQDAQVELWSAPTNGALTVTRLNGDMPNASADIDGGFYFQGPSFRITADGNSVFYVGEQNTVGVRELFVAPIATAGAWVDVSDGMASNGDVLRFDLTTDGATVVFRADKDADGEDEVYARPTDLSSGVIQLNGTLPTGGSVSEYAISPDSSQVVYRADQDQAGVFELYSVAITGGTPEQLNDELPVGGSVHPTFGITPNGNRVVFRAEGEQAGRIELYGVAIDGSAGMARLSPDLPGNVEEAWDLSANGLAVTFALDADLGNRRLYAGATSAGVTPLRLDPGSSFAPGVGLGPVMAAGNRVVYTAEQDAEDSIEVFSVPLLGGTPTKLNGPFAMLGLGEVTEFAATPEGERVVYLADADRPGSFELYVIPLDGSAASLRLNDPTPTQEHQVRGPIQVSPDGNWVLFHYGIDPLDPTGPEAFELYVAPLDGSSPQRRVNQDLAAGERVRTDMLFTPDSTRILFSVFSPVDATNDLWAAPVDGSSNPYRLADIVDPGGFAFDLAFTPDAQTLVYRAEQEVNFRWDLYSVPLDGSAPPTRLSEFQSPTAGDVGNFVVCPDGVHVLFEANQDFLDRYLLYRRPIDASAPATVLSVYTNPELRLSSWDLSDDGTVVVFAADGETAGVTEIYRIPVDGSAPAQWLAGPQVAGGDAWLPDIDPTGTHVVFRGDVDLDQVFELYTVRLDGSAPSTKLHAPLGGQRDVELYPTITADGSHVLFHMDGDVNNRIELYSAPVDGSALARRLNWDFPTSSGRVQFDIALTADGRDVVFRANPAGLEEVFQAPADGSRPARRLNLPLSGAQDIDSFELVPGGRAALYLGDQETQFVNELFLAPLERRLRRAADPQGSVTLPRR